MNQIMKNLKYIVTALAFVAFANPVANAQETQDINASATILADIALSFVSDVNFGNIQDTGSPVLPCI